jgi:hypothetical protein
MGHYRKHSLKIWRKVRDTWEGRAMARIFF